MYLFGFSREAEPVGWRYKEREELAHTTVKAEKSHDLSSEAGKKQWYENQKY